MRSNQQTVYAYDEAARSVTVTTPESVQVTTARTRHDETLSVTDGRGNVTAICVQQGRSADDRDATRWAR